MHISLAAEKIFVWGPLIITNTMLVTWIVILLLSTLVIFATKKMTEVPGKAQNIWEMIVEAILGMIEGVTQNRDKAKKFLPFVATLFLFIVCNNWFSLIPGFETIGRWENEAQGRILLPYFRSPNSDLNTTLALAITAMVFIQIIGVKNLGLRYFKKFLNFHGPVNFFVGIIETISEIARIISFSFRLFGNVFAGGVLLLVVTFLVPIIASVPFYGLELFVGFIQALVFSMLVTVFLELATQQHSES